MQLVLLDSVTAMKDQDPTPVNKYKHNYKNISWTQLQKRQSSSWILLCLIKKNVRSINIFRISFLRDIRHSSSLIRLQ